MQSGSIERCQICGVTLARRGDGFTCAHCLRNAERRSKMERPRSDKALRGPREDKAAR